MRRKSKFLFLSIGFYFMGIGIHGQSLFNWLLFACGLIHRCLIVLCFIRNFDVQIDNINSIIIHCQVVIFYIILIGKRHKIQTMICHMFTKLSRKEYMIVRMFDLFLTVLAFSPTIEKAFFNFTGIFNHCMSDFMIVPMFKNLNKATRNIICLSESLFLQQMDAACSLYLVVFLMTYIIKFKLINGITNNSSTRWKEEILFSSATAFNLHRQFEDVFSNFLFIKASHDFLTVLRYLFLLLKHEYLIYAFGINFIKYQIYMIIRHVFCTMFLFIFISWLQERIETRCYALRHRVLCDLYSKKIFHGSRIFDILLFNVFTKKVTVWQIMDVTRGTLLTLASAFVAFPVLFAQIDNGALVGETAKNMTYK